MRDWRFAISYLDPEVLQSGFGAIRASFLNLVRRIILGEFSEFFQRIFPAKFSALFLQGFRSPPKKNVTPKIQAQNCQQSSPI